ncbi:aldolase/citrate lyase family protein [Asanoa sp. NPDC050611]|uniref:aldolase/citrate lyase family protein n=1 Tax=Asanoa sp. NPDC050611 TaxID=3157098 RepID=UPI0033E221D1
MTPRSWLYVPGHRADRVVKALSSGADAVVVDLEDAVPPDQKTAARETAVRLAGSADRPLWVRVNDPTGPWGEADLDALAGRDLAGLRVPCHP